MQKLICTMLAGLLTIAMAHAANTPAFQVGQKWSIKGSGMTIVIGTIEPYLTDKTVISISVFDVPCPQTMGCATTIVGHAPFDSETLRQSVDKVIADHVSTAPDFQQGYANWKQAKGGVFTIPVNQLPDLLFKTMTPANRVREGQRT